jgi:3-(methylthio)propionyl---CoA ligase
MHGLMQRRELMIGSILQHAARHHGTTEIVSRREDGTIVRTTYGTLWDRSRRLAAVLQKLGVRRGDRVATLAMNSDRHIELYYAITGIGAICHTINPRLATDEIAWIAAHAEDCLIFVDPPFLPIVMKAAPLLHGFLHGVVVLTDGRAINPGLPPEIRLYGYEHLLATVPDPIELPTFDENSAAILCYTSGTTGRPKGVLYSHRSTVLHAMAMNSADTIGLHAVDRMLQVVPMFHVNAWGFPFVAPMAGAALIFPGRHLDPAALLHLLNAERATVSAAVPTVWITLFNHLRETGAKLETLKRIFSGGSAFPRTLMSEYAKLGVHVTHAWGMTESSPVATVNASTPRTLTLDPEARLDEQAGQGRPVFGIEVRAEDLHHREVPWDGRTQGNLACRGHWVASQYYRRPDTAVGPEGWFPTGDVGVIDPEGFIRLTDRTKDLIKSGGEWISSIELENIAIGHPDVAEAAAIAIPDEKWGERPLLVVVPRAGCSPTQEALQAFYEGKVPKWKIPDRVEVVESLPHGATGKLLKTELRRRYIRQPIIL